MNAGANYLPYGKLSKGWERFVFLSLFVGMTMIAADLSRGLCRPPRTVSEYFLSAGWFVFALAQVANKLPIAYRYRLPRIAAVADLACFSLGIASLVCFGLQARVVHSSLWYAASGILTAWLLASAVFSLARREHDGEPVPALNRVLASVVSSTYNAPMVLAAWLLANAAAA